MDRKNRMTLRVFNVVLLLIASLLILMAPAPAASQSQNLQVQPEILQRIIISSADTSSIPAIQVRAFGLESNGEPLEFTSENIMVRHDGWLSSDVEVVGTYSAGTFTVFVIDIPSGVAEHLPTIQRILEQYTSPPEMEEPVDFAAIYKVGEEEAQQLLEPNNFYNSFRNFFSSPLEVQDGPTALVDSLAALVNDSQELAPKEDILTSLVVISDGTDVVSSRYDPEDVGQLAAGKGVPIHTVWLENSDLQQASHDAGKRYLSELSAQTGAISVEIGQPDQIQEIWDRIASFRQHQVIEYRPSNLEGGSIEVELSLREDPLINDDITIDIAESTPTVEVDLPEEDRQLIIEELDKGVNLRFSGIVGWLDGEEREVIGAQLLVNGKVVQDIELDDLDRFKAELDMLNYGPNTIQIAIVDELEQKATSPELTITVTSEEPAEPGASPTQDGERGGVFNLVLACLIVSFLLVLLMLILYAINRRRSSGDRWRGPTRNQPNDDQEPSWKAGSSTTVLKGGTPRLEIVSSVTRMPATIDLTFVEHRIGRNPKEADIAFENDITVSRLHSAILHEGRDYRIYDKGSTSGTIVNGKKVPGFGYKLKDGDEIRLGEVLIRFRRGS